VPAEGLEQPKLEQPRTAAQPKVAKEVVSEAASEILFIKVARRLCQLLVQ